MKRLSEQVADLEDVARGFDESLAVTSDDAAVLRWRVEELETLIADFGRGVRTQDELLEAIR